MNTTEIQPEVVIVRTGSANIASVAAALTRLGTVPHISEDPDVVLAASVVVLPGVGAFGAAVTHLRERGLDEAICERVRCDRPLLAICLGMQLLCESSEEDPGVAGLGIVPAHVGRFGRNQRVPQMGWNRILPAAGCMLLRPEWMYFAHSFRVESIQGEWNISTTEYDGTFVSAIERGAMLACQFHPELSGSCGLALIGRWLSLAMGRKVIPC